MQIFLPELLSHAPIRRANAPASTPSATSPLNYPFELMFIQMLSKALHADNSEEDNAAVLLPSLGTLDMPATGNEGLGTADLLAWLADATTGRMANAPLGATAQQVAQAYRASTPQETSPSKQAFTQAMLPHAQAAARHLGVAPELIVAHAALESGWGKKAISHPDGRDSHNLFGVKAGIGWKGETVDVVTTEYVNGVARKETARFRAYSSPAEAFADYARLLAGNPRYRQVLGSGGDAVQFAQGLQRGGYATDPRYGEKLSRIALLGSNA